MENRSSISLALAGCDEHSHIHASAAKNTPGAEIVSCCDIDSNRAAAWADKYGCRSHYSSLGTMLKNEKPDAVILCTWPSGHLEQIRESLSTGVKNILCEKSLATSGRDAREISRIAGSHGAFIMEASMYRHHPAIGFLEKRLKNASVTSINAVFTNFEDDPAKPAGAGLNWRLKPGTGGGVPFDWMSYCVNASNHFSGGRPQRVYATGNFNKNYRIIDRLYGIIEYDNGVTGIVESGRDSSFSEMLRINTKGFILELPVAWGISGKIKILEHRRKTEWDYIETLEHPVGEADPYALQLQNFCNVIKGRGGPGMPLEESVTNVCTIEALVRSLGSKKPVTIVESH
jgi:predicted dehydrogenase